MLAALPLANARWRGGDAVEGPALDGPRNIKRMARPPAPAERRRVLLDLLGGSEANPLFEVVDADALRRALDQLEVCGPRERVQVMGAMAALIWLGETESRRVALA